MSVPLPSLPSAPLHPLKPFHTDNSSNRRRNPRFLQTCRYHEQLLRQHQSPVTGDHEQDAADGGEDGRWVESVVGVFRRGGGAVLVCVVVLREVGERLVRRNIEDMRYPRAESMTIMMEEPTRQGLDDMYD